jgi:hypothetical protein
MKIMTCALVLAAGCGGGMHYETVHLVNKTARPISDVYIYMLGAADHGTSKGALQPEGAADVKVPRGNVEVMAMSAKVEIDAHTRDQPSVTQDLELESPTTVIFYDVAHKPDGIDRPGVVGIGFTLAKSNELPPLDGPAPAAPSEP